MNGRPRGLASAVLLGALIASVGVASEASARSRHRGARRVDPPQPSIERLPSPPPVAVDRAVRCSCTSASSCPPIGTLSIAGHESQPVYCNQLHGAENPGVVTQGVWYFQCVELANRWLVEGLGAPRIGGHAQEMCDEADRSSYDVHVRGHAHEPVPGDLLVWEGLRFGHVGVVTEVSASSITFANQNFGHGGTQYPFLTTPRSGGFFGHPHGDAALRPKCIIHPKKLGGPSPRDVGPCAEVAASHDGTYCGASRQSGFKGGDPNTLYHCRGGTTAAVRCRSTCTMEPVGTDDHCS